MLEVGRLCVKTAGRDAMQYCVVVEVIDEKYVLVDGNTRRKKVNKAHIEPLNKILDIKKGATIKTILEAFEQEGIEIKKSAEPKPRKEKKTQEKKAKKHNSKKAETKSKETKAKDKETKTKAKSTKKTDKKEK